MQNNRFPSRSWGEQAAISASTAVGSVHGAQADRVALVIDVAELVWEPIVD